MRKSQAHSNSDPEEKEYTNLDTASLPYIFGATNTGPLGKGSLRRTNIIETEK